MPYPGSSTYPGSTTYPGTDGGGTVTTPTGGGSPGPGPRFSRRSGALLRRLRQSNNVGGTGGGGGVAHGPTVQIASVPATLTLAHGATGSALAGTPQDISAVSTGQRKYFHSSDVTIVTVDADTGVPTGVAAGSATITEDFIAPALPFAPATYTPATDILIFNEPFHYASATAMGAYDSGGTGYNDTSHTYLAPRPSPRLTGGGATVPDNYTILDSTRPSAEAGERMFVLGYHGTNGDAPLLFGFIQASDYPDPARTTYHDWWCQFDFSSLAGIPWALAIREKFFETGFPGEGGRCQWSITDSAPNAGSAVCNSAWDSPGVAGVTPRSLGFQKVGPYPGEVFQDRLWHRYRFASRTHAAAAGTVDCVLMTSAGLILKQIAPGVVHLHDRIGLRDTLGGPLNSTASFEITALDDTGWTNPDDGTVHPVVSLVRHDDGGATTDVGITPLYQNTWQARFSADQTGLLSVGEYFATGGSATGGFKVTSIIDGHTMAIDQIGALEANLQRDYLGKPFARSRDGFTGFSRMWVDGTLIMNHCKAAIGDPTVPAFIEHVAQLGVAMPCTQALIGDNQTLGPGIGDGEAIVPWNMNITQVITFTRMEP